MARGSLTRFAWLSIAAAVVTIGLKGVAWQVTDSVGLLSDALESVVNFVAAVLALYVLAVAARPPDEEHMFGHDKAEYFSSGIEGGLIVIAGFSIAISAVNRLMNPRELGDLGLGLLLAVIASVVNFAVARVLLGAGRQYHSITLEADARHLMADVWTTAAVLIGLLAGSLTGFTAIDPILALLVAGHIAWNGFRLLQRSAQGLMDRALDPDHHQKVEEILTAHRTEHIRFHALRTRQSGGTSFVSFHVLVPGDWSVQEGHDLLETIEAEIRQALPTTVAVLTHLEPIEDPTSWHDVSLIRN